MVRSEGARSEGAETDRGLKIVDRGLEIETREANHRQEHQTR